MNDRLTPEERELIAAAINLKKWSDRGRVIAVHNKRFDDAVSAYQASAKILAK